jgi:stage II sporulation protein AA (anti-sigma F factor antagonist)
VIIGRDARGVVTIAGEIDMHSIISLEDQLADLPGAVLLDLSQVRFIDAAGVGILAREYVRRQQAGCRLVIVAASPAVELVLNLTGLFEIMTEPLLRRVS